MVTLKDVVDAIHALGYSLIEGVNSINGSVIYADDIRLSAEQSPQDVPVDKYVCQYLEKRGFYGYKGWTVYKPTKHTAWGVSDEGVIKDKSMTKVKKTIDERTASLEITDARKKVCKPDELQFIEKEPKKVVKPKKARVIKKVDKEGRTGHRKSNETKSIKNEVLDLIMSGKSDPDIVTHIREEFPDSRFDAKHISWYRSTWYRDGVIPAEFAPKRSKAYKAWLQQASREEKQNG